LADRYKFCGGPTFINFSYFPLLPEFSLQGKVYIVTGGGRGLGVALAGAIIEAGAKKVYCLDLLPEPHEGWYQMKSQLGSQGDALVFKSQNVTDEEGIEKIFEDVVKVEGRLDGLVCAAVFSH
jgi:NAD(P)-dependent dehydrogenase (short-subunit alcohol dehydrogenase family)